MCVFNDYRLTGGVFFALLLDSMSKSRLLSRPNIKRANDNEVLRDLFRVFNPSFEYTEGETQSKVTRCSNFKKCGTDEREFFLYVTEEERNALKETVLSDYKTHLSRFDRFLYNCRFVPAHAKPFVYRLLALLSLDVSIPEDELLYTQEDGTALTKSKLLKSDTINFNSFVFGIWLYVCFRNENNTIGKATYDHFWKPKTEQHSIRVFVDTNPQLGSEFVDLTVLFAERATEGTTEIQAESNMNDESQNEASSDERSPSTYDLACFNQLQSDFDSLLPFCISTNPFKKGVFDNGELTSIKELIEKWRSICFSIAYLPFKTVVQDLIMLLEQYASFYSDPHVAYITKKKMNLFIPCFEDDIQMQHYSDMSGYAMNNMHLRRVYEVIYHQITS